MAIASRPRVATSTSEPDPEGLTIADVTGNGMPDLVVANEGSNDLSIFLGSGRGADWKLEPGPRLRVGVPVISTTVADMNGDGVPDIIAVSRESDLVVALRGVGGGFFDDGDPVVLPTGIAPDPSVCRQVRRLAEHGPGRARLGVERPDLLLEYLQRYTQPPGSYRPAAKARSPE